jgi:hypothetical protein
MNADPIDTTKLLRQLYRALSLTMDEARRAGVSFGPDSPAEKALDAYSAWNLTVPDDDEC